MNFSTRHRLAIRTSSLILVGVILTSVFSGIFENKLKVDKYNISSVVGTLLTESVPQYEEKLVVDSKTGAIKFNEGYQPGQEVVGDSVIAKSVAEFGSSPNNAVRIDDVQNSVSLTFTPKFKVDRPQKYENKVIYPIASMNASKVYTTQGTGIKEDIILFDKGEDKLEFEYEISLSAGLEMRMESDGSIGVYAPEGPLAGPL